MKKVLLSWFILLACCKAEMPEPAPETFVWDTYEVSDSLTAIGSGDSHIVNSFPIIGGYDSIWFNKMQVRVKGKYNYANFINMADAGGRTVGSAMPAWYNYSSCNFCNSEAQYSIDTILKQNPDLIILCFTGNHTVNHMSADEAIYCFKYLIDTMRSLNKAFVITGQSPRQKTFTGGMTLKSYYDSSQKINAFLQSYAPKSYVENYHNMEDTIFHYRPWPYVLANDSLHWSNAGNELFFENHMNTYIMDSIMADFDPRAINFKLTKSGSNLILSGKYRMREIYISGSNDNSTWTLMQAYSYPQTSVSTVSETFSKAGYEWYKVEVVSGRMRYTVTKHIP